LADQVEANRAGDKKHHVNLIVHRLRFAPALRSLESLDVPKSFEFDKQATLIYPFLKDEHDTLRNVLIKYTAE
jgi:hypothetical protein